MAIRINIDVMLTKRKMSVTELPNRVGITMANLSILKNGKARAIRFSTLEALCRALECQPGDILEYVDDGRWRNQYQDLKYANGMKQQKITAHHKHFLEVGSYSSFVYIRFM